MNSMNAINACKICLNTNSVNNTVLCLERAITHFASVLQELSNSKNIVVRNQARHQSPRDRL